MIIQIKTDYPNSIGSILARLLRADYDFSLKHQGATYFIYIDESRDKLEQLLNPVKLIYGMNLEFFDQPYKRPAPGDDRRSREII